MVFPDGIEYNREKDQCRTLTVNPVFSYVAHIAKDLTGGGNEDNKILDNFTAVVIQSGVEARYWMTSRRPEFISGSDKN